VVSEGVLFLQGGPGVPRLFVLEISMYVCMCVCISKGFIRSGGGGFQDLQDVYSKKYPKSLRGPKTGPVCDVMRWDGMDIEL